MEEKMSSIIGVAIPGKFAEEVGKAAIDIAGKLGLVIAAPVNSSRSPAEFNVAAQYPCDLAEITLTFLLRKGKEA